MHCTADPDLQSEMGLQQHVGVEACIHAERLVEHTPRRSATSTPPCKHSMSCLGLVATTCQPVAQFSTANLDPLRQTTLSAKRIRLSSNDQHNAGLHGHARAVTDQEWFAAASGIRVRAITALKHFDCIGTSASVVCCLCVLPNCS